MEVSYKYIVEIVVLHYKPITLCFHNARCVCPKRGTLCAGYNDQKLITITFAKHFEIFLHNILYLRETYSPKYK